MFLTTQNALFYKFPDFRMLPYHKEGKDMRNGGGTLLLEGDKKEYEAMGHCSAYSFPDGDFFFCHGYSVPKNGASILVQKKINWTKDGWLTLE